MCEEFVTGYINDQRTQFKRLGVNGEWDNPYVTLKHEFEAEQTECLQKWLQRVIFTRD